MESSWERMDEREGCAEIKTEEVEVLEEGHAGQKRSRLDELLELYGKEPIMKKPKKKRVTLTEVNAKVDKILEIINKWTPLQFVAS